MDEDEKNSRQQFYRKTGKTPEEEAEASTSMFGWVFVIALGVAAVAVWSIPHFTGN